MELERDLSSLRVLIVDDARQSRMIAAEILQRQGIGTIFFAEDGREALSATVEHRPDLILLDLVMPHVDGYAFCRAIRKNPRFADTPIIAQTGVSEPQRLAAAFAAGATDFVMKPINSDELIARTRVHLERLALLQGLKEYLIQLDEEMKSARAMQSLLLPGPHLIGEIEREFNLNIAAHFQSSAELSGDMWAMQRLSGHELGFYLVDFSGHGILAALNTFRLDALIRSHEDHLLSVYPGQFLDHLNRYLYGLMPTRQFATMLCGLIDTQANLLRYSVAASTNPVLLRSDGSLAVLSGRDFPLSVREDASFRTQEVPFLPGDTLFCYSDALIEKESSDGKMFNEAQLLDTLERYQRHLAGRPIEAQALIQHVQTSFFRETGCTRLHDDMTLVAFHRN